MENFSYTKSDKLDGENYVNWKFKVDTLLEGLDEKKKWVLLRMSVKDNIIPYIRDYQTSDEILKKLKELYEVDNANRKLYLKSKLFSIKMEENENMSSFISRIKDLQQKLADIKEEIQDPDLVAVTLNGLLDEYQMFVTGLAAREKAPKFDELAGILIQEEERRGFNQKSPNSDLALVAKVKQAFKGKQWEKNKEVESNLFKQSRDSCILCGVLCVYVTWLILKCVG